MFTQNNCGVSQKSVRSSNSLGCFQVVRVENTVWHFGDIVSRLNGIPAACNWHKPPTSVEVLETQAVQLPMKYAWHKAVYSQATIERISCRRWMPTTQLILSCVVQRPRSQYAVHDGFALFQNKQLSSRVIDRREWSWMRYRVEAIVRCADSLTNGSLSLFLSDAWY